MSRKMVYSILGRPSITEYERVDLELKVAKLLALKQLLSIKFTFLLSMYNKGRFVCIFKFNSKVLISFTFAFLSTAAYMDPLLCYSPSSVDSVI